MTVFRKEDIPKHLKSLAIASAGALLTVLTQWATGVDFGGYSVWVAAGLAFLANVVNILSKQDDPKVPKTLA